MAMCPAALESAALKFPLRPISKTPGSRPGIPQRKGILTHPAWLIAHSTNFHADAIRRGRWVREKLLAGRVPDIPITVDAQVPEDPHRTFRERVESVTQPEPCWKYHQYMSPVGLPFEMYDDFGRYRMEEFLENPENLIKSGDGKSTFDVYKTLPVVTSGQLSGTGDPRLDGNLTDAVDLIARLAKSERTRQSIIRHAFLAVGGLSLPGALPRISAAQTMVRPGGAAPMRFIFMHKGNGMFPAFLVPPAFSAQELEKKKRKDAFMVDRDSHTLPDWMGPLEAHEETTSPGRSRSSTGEGPLGC
jgi:hypothetical protein